MKIETIEHPTQKGLTVEAVKIESADDLRELRASDWHDNALVLLTYPSSVVGYLSHETPKMFGARVDVGCTILKGPAGDFDVIHPIPADARA